MDNLLTTLLGSLLGVLLGLWGNRAWERRQQKRGYAARLRVVSHELNALSALAQTVIDGLRPGRITPIELSAPALRASLGDPIVNQRASQGLLGVLVSLSVFIQSMQNTLELFRTPGAVVTPEGIGRARERFAMFGRGVRYVIEQIDAELRRMPGAGSDSHRDNEIAEGWLKVWMGSDLATDSQ